VIENAEKEKTPTPLERLVPFEALAKLKPDGWHRANDDPPVTLKWFTPDAGWTWFVVEAEVVLSNGKHVWPEEASILVEKGHRGAIVDVLCYGYAVSPLMAGDDPMAGEWGRFSARELAEDVRGPWGLEVERDEWFEAGPFSEVRRRYLAERGRRDV
jgi:hypothetical protein